MPLREIATKDLVLNPFEKIGREWMLVTAGDEEDFNTMTASWGGLGVLWGHDVATCYIRQSRFTKEFVDSAERLTLSFYGPEWKGALRYLGTVSGRDEDKVEEAGLTPLFVDGTTTFEEASLTLVCRKLSATYLGPDSFLDPTIDGAWYADHDYHTMYICEIERVLECDKGDGGPVTSPGV